jgi:hypothetical protein
MGLEPFFTRRYCGSVDGYTRFNFFSCSLVGEIVSEKVSK